MSTITVTLDVTALQDWSKQAIRKLGNGLRSAVDASATKARREAVKVIAKDARVPADRMRKYLPLVKRSTAGPNPTATWSITPSKNSIRDMSGAVAYQRGVPVEVSTFAISGGPMASKTLKRGFVISANGGTIMMERTGKGRGAFHPVYAERSTAAMGYTYNIPRQIWDRVALDSMVVLTAQAVQNALNLMDTPASITSILASPD